MSSTLTLWTNVPGATVRLWSKAVCPEPASSELAYDERYADPQGNTSFMFVPEGPCVAYVTHPDYKPLEFPTTMPDDGAHVLLLERAAQLSRLVRLERHRCVGEDGQRVFLRGCSDFLLLRRFLAGENVAPLLEARRALGFNLVRVFGMCHYVPVNEFGWPPFKPQDYGDAFFDGVLGLARLCANFGHYVYLSAFPDNALLMPQLADQQRHHRQLVDVLRQAGNALYELTNEVDAHDFNRVDAAQFDRPQGLLSCAGSAGEGVHPHVWDFFDFHPRRFYPGHIKDCNLADNPNYLAGHEGILGEPDRFGSNGNGNAMQAFESAGSARGTALGIVFHSRCGLRSESFDDETRLCAEAFLEAVR